MAWKQTVDIKCLTCTCGHLFKEFNEEIAEKYKIMKFSAKVGFSIRCLM